MVLNLEASILGLLGGSWVVISRVISGVTILITHIRGLITLLITTHEPPSRPSNYPLIYAKFPQLRAIRTLLKGPLGSWLIPLL